MINYKYNVLYSIISYRRNLKDIPFVNKLSETELAFANSQSISEIFGEELSFKKLKNLDFKNCLLLEEDEILTDRIIENKDIASFGINEDLSKIIYVNEEDHIRILVKKKGFCLEDVYKLANDLDEKLLEKLEIAFDENYGYLTANPSKMGTGLELEALLFIPSLLENNKWEKIEKELTKENYLVLNIDNKPYKKQSPFIKIKNLYTFGAKENEIASKFKNIIEKILELETLEENNIFELSTSKLVDKIFRALGLAKYSYRISFDESINLIATIFWGLKLNVLKQKTNIEFLDLIHKLKDNHLSLNNENLKEIEKLRSKFLASFLENSIIKGDIDV